MAASVSGVPGFYGSGYVDPNNISTLGQPYSINVAQARRMSYLKGGYFKSIGKGESLNGVPELQKLDAKRHFVNGDGSCWSRATWQCVLSQVLTDDAKYDRFITTIANPKVGHDIPEPLAAKAIYIIGQLKELTTEASRVDYINHACVDDDLIFFMRHVAAEHMKAENKRDGRYAMFQSSLDSIKTCKDKYGGPEMVAFVEYFDLELHTITQNDQGRWVHRSVINRDTKTKFVAELEAKDIPHNCLFGANAAHFEFISFANVPAQGAFGSDQKGCLTDKELNVIKDQIEADFKLAEELQAKFDADAREIEEKEREDKALALKKQGEEDLAYLEEQRLQEQDARLAEKEQQAEDARAKQEAEDARFAAELTEQPEPHIFPAHTPGCSSPVPTPPDSPRSSDSRGSSDSNSIPANPPQASGKSAVPPSQLPIRPPIPNNRAPSFPTSPSSRSSSSSQSSRPTSSVTDPTRSSSPPPTDKPVPKKKKSFLSLFSGVFSSMWDGLKTLGTWFRNLFRKFI